MAGELKYKKLTEKIIGCSMKVHRKMGNGYNEYVYSKCLPIEIDRAGIKYKREFELPIYYDEFIITKKRVDFLVEEKISVELKALTTLTNQNLAQALNYLEAQRLEIGLLINFGAPSLQFKRLINQYKLQQSNPVNPCLPGRQVSQNPANPRL